MALPDLELLSRLGTALNLDEIRAAMDLPAIADPLPQILDYPDYHSPVFDSIIDSTAKSMLDMQEYLEKQIQELLMVAPADYGLHPSIGSSYGSSVQHSQIVQLQMRHDAIKKDLYRYMSTHVVPTMIMKPIKHKTMRELLKRKATHW